MIRVGIADDDSLRCAGLRAVLATFPDLTVVGCTSRAGVAALVEEHRTDILLIDSRMAGALDLCGRLRHAGRPRTILISVDGDDAWAVRALECGARGLLLCSVDLGTLDKAIRVVHEGQIWAPQQILSRVVDDAAVGREDREGRRRATDRLTERERDVLALAGQGLSNKEIGARLTISPATVKAHLTRVFQKLGLRDRVQLAVRYGSHVPFDSLPGEEPTGEREPAGTSTRGVRRPT